MDKVDLNDLELDIQETFFEIGERESIKIQQFMKEETSIYKESKKKKYTDPVSVIGRIKLSPLAEEISDIGRASTINAIFTFATKDLKDSGFLEERALSITLDDRILYDDEAYSIYNIVPTAMIGDRFLLYKFECRKV